ncbi:MAG: 2-oxoacid:acceptor oxidoreductase subunit alpha [Planctomycetota bacterium]|jgi:2-oxoglutarate ferredoxin oxidoreductase subunit alpha
MGTKQLETLEDVVIHFAGDSGDGMQITGTQFSNTTAVLGNDLATFPDFPAEIRAPAGTLPGVSGFQVHFASTEIYTPGDTPDVLVAMNPAALKVNLKDVPAGGIVVVDTDAFSDRDLKKAEYESNPLEDGTLDGYRLFAIPLTTLTEKALREFEEQPVKAKRRCKNFYALGMMYWLYSRPLETSEEWIEEKWGKRLPAVRDMNMTALKAGYAYCEATEAFQVRYEVAAAPSAPGTYRNIMGNDATALGLVAASVRSKLPLFYGSYPITPASQVLHSLSKYKNFGVMTFQAEDEIAAMTSTIGAAFGGRLAVTGSSGPGIALKAEAMGLALMVELPMVIVNVQRAGPSTGMPTKTEQSDLLQAMYCRNGDGPIPIIAAQSPSDCFHCAFEAARIALKYMVPVLLLTDGYIANGAEPWKLPEELEDLPEIPVEFRTNPEGFEPYARDDATLARRWVKPGTPALEHRVGGLEKDSLTGNVSYDPANHQRMTDLRAEKVARVVNDIPALEPFGEAKGKVLVVGWGGTYGAIHSAVKRCQAEGLSVSQVHLRHLNPFPGNFGELLNSFDCVLVPELNAGQLLMLLRAKYLVDAVGYNKVEGQPFKTRDLVEKIQEIHNA